MDRYEKDLFAFLIGNMKQMEIELRAHSMLFEAIAQNVVPAEDVGAFIEAARNSFEMLRFVEEKYRLLSKAEDQQTTSHSARTPQCTRSPLIN